MTGTATEYRPTHSGMAQTLLITLAVIGLVWLGLTWSGKTEANIGTSLLLGLTFPIWRMRNHHHLRILLDKEGVTGLSGEPGVTEEERFRLRLPLCEIDLDASRNQRWSRWLNFRYRICDHNGRSIVIPMIFFGFHQSGAIHREILAAAESAHSRTLGQPVTEFLAPKPSVRNSLIGIAGGLLGLATVEWLIALDPAYADPLRSGCYATIGAGLFTLMFPNWDRHRGAIYLYRDRVKGPAGENDKTNPFGRWGSKNLALSEINLQKSQSRGQLERLHGDYHLHDNQGNSICIDAKVFGRQGAKEVFHQLHARITDHQRALRLREQQG
ncbi:hypothetical protein [Ferrimonas sp. YFM]|uniref:hypothetical protein n=1 Tax=Ferrimonas sp. YFM TaxID=3028878 RepID=UPI002574183F|nr:hypothetical protein [Ferrimonas sp. YFM]BDY04261.1 hypothetical protein F0521_13020 [Ferrimonas sp. YFM]